MDGGGSLQRERSLSDAILSASCHRRSSSSTTSTRARRFAACWLSPLPPGRRTERGTSWTTSWMPKPWGSGGDDPRTRARAETRALRQATLPACWASTGRGGEGTDASPVPSSASVTCMLHLFCFKNHAQPDSSHHVIAQKFLRRLVVFDFLHFNLSIDELIHVHRCLQKTIEPGDCLIFA